MKFGTGNRVYHQKLTQHGNVNGRKDDRPSDKFWERPCFQTNSSFYHIVMNCWMMFEIIPMVSNG